jgi:hypothetical protein
MGKVEESSGGFFAVRDIKRVPLEMSADVFEFDILETDEGGFGRVRFIDDSVIELRGGTSVSVKDVVFTESRNRFNIGVASGVVRVVTGAIVRRNPRGFKVTTPKSTIGIRGTVLTVSVNRDTRVESVSVESMGDGHSVSVSNSATGEEATITGQGAVNTNASDAISTDGAAHMGGPTSGGASTGGDAGQGFSGSGGGGGGNDGGGSSSGGGSSGGGGGSSSGGGCGDTNSSPGR